MPHKRLVSLLHVSAVIHGIYTFFISDHFMTLFQSQIDECLDNFNFELAVKFCERALDIEPDNVEVLEMAGAVYLETGETDKAKTVSFIC